MSSPNEAPVDECRPECEPLAPVPAWWSGFLFQVLNPRQVCMYTYLTMLGEDGGTCYPTIEQIRQDLGLYSTSMVFEALSILEDLAFVKRERHTFPGTRAKRNVYRRPPCEQTVLRLLERELLDAGLRPAGKECLPAAPESRALLDRGLRDLLASEYERYARTADDAKREVLIGILQSRLVTEGGS